MRSLMVILMVVALAGGACAGPADPKAAFLAAYGTFLDAMQASTVEGQPIPEYASRVGAATTTFVGDLEGSSLPDAVRADAAALIKEATILIEQTSAVTTGTDREAMPVALLGITEQARKVRNAATVVARDLGVVGDLGDVAASETTVGSSSVPVLRSDSCGAGNGWTCESIIGDVITDALRAAAGTDFALMNSGGIRADLTCSSIDSISEFCPPSSPPPYPITRGQVNTVLPFGNITVAASIDGATMKTMLENGVSQMPMPDFRFPQVSGLCFTYDIEAAMGSRVTGAVRQAEDGSCTGTVVDLTAASSYTLATNNYVVAGGDSYPVVTDFVMSGYLDQEVADALATFGTISPVLQDRIVCADPDPGSGGSCPTVVP